jgi:hypothetical protein
MASTTRDSFGVTDTIAAMHPCSRVNSARSGMMTISAINGAREHRVVEMAEMGL